MQAITTKYLSPTNHRGARISARCAAGSCALPWDYALNPQENHRAAAMALARRFKWSGRWVSGDTAEGTVWVNAAWAFSEPRETFNIDLEERA